jgi:hypothetical protein
MPCSELQRLLNEYRLALGKYGKAAAAHVGGTGPSVDAHSNAASAISVRLFRVREELERHVREHGCAES